MYWAWWGWTARAAGSLMSCPAASSREWPSPGPIVADEPTGNLDPARSLEIMTLLERINALGTTVVVVTHEKSLVNHFDKRVIMIDHGVVAATGVGRYEVAAHA